MHSNYTKLNIILEAKYAHELETMYFSSDDETNFRSDSTAGLEHQEEIQTIEPEADVVTFEDWEEFIMEKTSKKRKATSSN